MRDCKDKDNCSNYQYSAITDACTNFKPKQHPLDDLIAHIMLKVGGLSDTEHLLNKLRYESIKWAWKNNGLYGTYDTKLKSVGKENWIPE